MLCSSYHDSKDQLFSHAVMNIPKPTAEMQVTEALQGWNCNGMVKSTNLLLNWHSMTVNLPVEGQSIV